MRSLEERDVTGIIMVSPFVSFIIYRVLDGCRLIATHEPRHFEQARPLMQEPGFSRWHKFLVQPPASASATVSG